MPFGQARFGANILGYTNASSCVVTVDQISVQLVAGNSIIIAACISSTPPNLNGKYLVTNVSGNQITLDVDTTAFGTYVSGGFLTILQLANPNPSDQENFYHQFEPYVVYNLNQVPTFGNNNVNP